MNQKFKSKPCLGIVGLAQTGYNLGEDLAPGKFQEMLNNLEGLGIDIIAEKKIVVNTEQAREVSRKFQEKKVDFICAVICTFVPDYYIVELLHHCDVPIFLWAIEREMKCIALVCGPLITSTLYDLEKEYALYGADVKDSEVTEELKIFARAAMMRRILKEMRVGYIGFKPNIMFSMSADEYGLKKIMGVSVCSFPDEEYCRRVAKISNSEAEKEWERIKKNVNSVHGKKQDCIDSAKGFLAMKKMADEMNLDAISINCWPYLKSKVCIPIACLNDVGISAACEGDLYSTILMHLLSILSMRPTANGDLLRIFPERNQIMFSHCGAGAFSLAKDKKDIVLHQSIETNDGLAVFYPCNITGTVTGVNLMGYRSNFRIAVFKGEVEKTEMVYEGNPMRIHFQRDVRQILQDVSKKGAGHHWNIAYGNFVREFELLTNWLGIKFNLLI